MSDGAPNECGKSSWRELLFSSPLFLLLFGALAVQLLLDWPPTLLERQRQRKIVLERISRAGGWQQLEQDCRSIAKLATDGEFVWAQFRDSNSVLPASIAALNPSEVRLYSSEVFRQFERGLDTAVVHIKLFGLHATDGHSTPYYGLDIAWGAASHQYRPEPSEAVSGNGHRTYRQIAEDVFEVY